MIKLLTVVGARPQFIKASALSTAIRSRYSDRIQEVLVHSGQHYDAAMSDVFFQELGLPKPDYSLGAASPGKVASIGEMTNAIAQVITDENPDVVLVFGDTNTTLAGALAANQCHKRLIHVEAGLRSYDKSMPEEVNRLLTDHISTWLFAPTPIAVENLRKENLIHRDGKAEINAPHIAMVGDIMYDVALQFQQKIESLNWSDLSMIEPDRPYILCTLHRVHNTASDRLLITVTALIASAEENQFIVLWPLHPRTAGVMNNWPDETRRMVEQSPWIRFMEPQSYLHTQFLISHASLIATDSGGLQKEAYYVGKKSILFREETEWDELTHQGHALLVGTDPEKIQKGIREQLERNIAEWPAYYGDGHTADHVIETVLRTC